MFHAKLEIIRIIDTTNYDMYCKLQKTYLILHYFQHFIIMKTRHNTYPPPPNPYLGEKMGIIWWKREAGMIDGLWYYEYL